MPGARTNQIADNAVTSAKLAELSAALKYNGSFDDVNDLSLDGKSLASINKVIDLISSNLEGLDVKESVRACTINNLFAVPSGVGETAILTSLDEDFRDLQVSVDSVALVDGDRVLVKNNGGAVLSVGEFAAESAGNYSFTDTGEFGKFFEFVDPFGQGYYIWFDDGNDLGDPAGAATPGNQPTGGYIGIEATITPGATPNAIALAVRSAILGSGAFPFIVEVDVSTTTGFVWIVWITQSSGNDVVTVNDGSGLGALPGVVSFDITTPGDPDGDVGVRNGIYVYQGTAGNTQPWVLTRASDFNADAEVTANAFTFVEEGLSCADTGWTLTTNDPITLDTTGLAWAQFSSSGSISAGDGLTQSGSVISADIDDTTIGFTAGDFQLEVKDGGVSANKLDRNPVIPGIFGDLFITDSPRAVSYANAINPKPQFAASVDLTGLEGVSTFEHGEAISFAPSGAEGIFMGFDTPAGQTQMFYLPTNATVPATGDTITGGSSGATFGVNATPNNQRANTPDGVTTAFDLSVATYDSEEAPLDSPTVFAAFPYRNGLLQKEIADNLALEGGVDECSIINNQIVFADAPDFGEEIIVKYIAQQVNNV